MNSRLLGLLLIAALTACGGDDDNGGGDEHDDDIQTPTCPSCPAQATCSEATGYSCVCNNGYAGADCADVDECAVDNGGCDVQTSCTNTEGSFTCGACPEGTTGTGATACYANPPQLTAITAIEAVDAGLQPLLLAGTGFTDAAVASFGAVDIQTEFIDATSIRVFAPQPFPNAATPLTIRNTPVAAGPRSNNLWLDQSNTLSVLDLELDVAPIGGVVTVHARGFGEGAMTVTDSGAHAMAGSAVTTGTDPWGGDSQMFTFTVADGATDGPLTVSDGTLTFTTRPFFVGTNIAPTATASASTVYSEDFAVTKLNDGLLDVSWFSTPGDCATDPSCTSVPWVELTWASPQTVRHLGVRGPRDYPAGYNVYSGTFTLYDGETELAHVDVVTDVPYADANVTLPAAVANVTRVRFTSTFDTSNEPGIAEVLVY